jgi:hypothetical protein
VPAHRWFPADAALRETFYERLPPLVAKVREEVFAWRRAGHTGASATSISLLPLVVLYVARTRAKDALVVTGFEPASDFLTDLPRLF